MESKKTFLPDTLRSYGNDTFLAEKHAKSSFFVSQKEKKNANIWKLGKIDVILHPPFSEEGKNQQV